MNSPGNRLFYEPRDIRYDVLQGQRGDVSLDLQLRLYVLTEFGNRNFRQVIFITQEIVDHQHALAIDRLLDRFIATEGVLLEWKRKRLDF